MTSVASQWLSGTTSRPVLVPRVGTISASSTSHRPPPVMMACTKRRMRMSVSRKSATVEEPSTTADTDQATDGSSESAPEKKKYYRTVPGFPGMLVEFEEPEKKRVRGEVVWWKVLLLTMGVGLMFSQATMLVSLFYA